MTTIFKGLLDRFHACLTACADERLQEFAAALDWSMAERTLAPNALACLRHLDRLSELAPPAERPLAAFLSQHRDKFCWGQTYTQADFSRHFIDNYGWLEVFGTRGHFSNDTMAGGVLVLGPQLVYPDHHHVAEEMYIPLTGGTQWRKGDGDFHVRQRANSFIIHRM